MRIIGAILAAFALLLTAGRGLACSPTPDFVRATSFDMVEQADAVVIARAVGLRRTDGPWGGSVTFQIEQALKGEPPATVEMENANLGRIERSDPNDLATIHPESLSGGCYRSTFERGRSYVLFLARGPDGQGWKVLRFVFARGTEDYDGPDSLWVRALRGHIEIQRNPDRMAQLEALAARLPQLERPGASAADHQLALDIRDHLSSLSPDKPTPYLIAAYEAVERGESPRFPGRSLQADREGGMADTVTDMIFDIHEPELDKRRVEAFILRSLANGDHPDAEPLFERIVSSNPSPQQLGLAIRYFSQNHKIRRAYEVVEIQALPRLGGLSNDEASGLVGDIATALRGPDWTYEGKHEAWMDDAYVRARWPETALSLFWDLRRRGSGLTFEAIEALRPTDYRARPEVTLALAAGYDERVRDWALAEVNTRLATADWLKDDDPLWLPLQALAVGFGEDIDAGLIKAFCGGESGRIMTMTTLAFRGEELDANLLVRMLASPVLDDEERAYARHALSILDGRTTDMRNDLIREGPSHEAVIASAQSKPITEYSDPVKPIVCPAA
jgi:hypothetical protein